MTTETTPGKKRTYIYLRMSQLFKSVQYAYRSKHFLRLNEGDIGVCGIAVLDNFSCGISVIYSQNAVLRYSPSLRDTVF